MPKGGLVWFQVKFLSLFTDAEAKEYEEYLSMISEQTFLDLFKKDRYGFVLTDNEMLVPSNLESCAVITTHFPFVFIRTIRTTYEIGKNTLHPKFLCESNGNKLRASKTTNR